MTDKPSTVGRRRFSDEDIAQLCDAIMAKTHAHTCRFDALRPEEVRDAVLFHRHVNSLMTETGSTIRKTVIVSGITGLLSLLVLGLYSKIKTALGL